MLQIDEKYTKKVPENIGKDPLIPVDGFGIIKPHGKEFENLGVVRDQVKIASMKKIYGY